MTDVTVIGAGYVGLTAAACLARLGNRVTVVECDAPKLQQLTRGQVTIREPGLEGLVREGLRLGRLTFTADSRRAVSHANIVMVAVNTPAGPHGQADTTIFNAAINEIALSLTPGTSLAIKSTVPPGTSDSVAEVLKSRHVRVLSNPEFLSQGCAVDCFMRPERTVIGAEKPSDARELIRLYRALDAPVAIVRRRSAELAKYASNSFLAMKVSFINEIAGICEAVDADIGEVAEIVGLDARIGPAFLNAGIGWGGSCFPKDVVALSAVARARGASHAILDATHEVNTRQRERAVEHIASALSYRRDPTVAVLGLAFKPGTDDVRGSPALEITARLLEQGFRVRAHDPAAMENSARHLPNIRYCADPYEAAEGAHALLLATDWPEYLDLDWPRIRDEMPGALVVDGRNVLDPTLLTSLGFLYRGFGRAASAMNRPVSSRQRHTRRPGPRSVSSRLTTGGPP